MRYHVVLRGPSSDEPGSTRELAGAIAGRYGVPAEAILERLAVGGFRVKTDVDLDTAMAYAVDLTKLGGACIVVDAVTGEAVSQPGRVPQPVGLAAAGTHSSELGALESGRFVVSTLDGQLDSSAAGDDALALDTSPYQPRELATPTPSANHFAPPPSDVADEALVLADDPRVSKRSRTRASAEPPLAPPEPVSTPPEPGLSERAAGLIASARRSLATRGKLFFAGGVLVAVLSGFVAAHVLAVLQESSAYAPVHKEVREAYAEATDPDSHAALGQIRAGMQEVIDSRKQRIAVTGALVWIIAGAGIGFLWFRKIDWERLKQ